MRYGVHLDGSGILVFRRHLRAFGGVGSIASGGLRFHVVRLAEDGAPGPRLGTCVRKEIFDGENAPLLLVHEGGVSGPREQEGCRRGRGKVRGKGWGKDRGQR